MSIGPSWFITQKNKAFLFTYLYTQTKCGDQTNRLRNFGKH